MWKIRTEGHFDYVMGAFRVERFRPAFGAERAAHSNSANTRKLSESCIWATHCRNGYCRKSTKCSNHVSQGTLSRALFEYCHAHKYFWALIFKKIASDFKFLPNMEKKSPKFEHFNRLSLIFFLLSRWALAKKSSHKFPAEQLVDFLQYWWILDVSLSSPQLKVSI